MTCMWLVQQRKQGLTTKKLSCKNILSIIQFSQNLMQQGWKNKNPFQQLPYVGPKEAAAIQSILGAKETIYQFCLKEEQ